MSSEISMLILCVVIVAIGGAYQILRWLIDRHFMARRIKALAARRDQLERDLAAHRALRDNGIEQQAGDPYNDTRIAAELLYIPQPRRTEEDQ